MRTVRMIVHRVVIEVTKHMVSVVPVRSSVSRCDGWVWDLVDSSPDAFDLFHEAADLFREAVDWFLKGVDSQFTPLIRLLMPSTHPLVLSICLQASLVWSPETSLVLCDLLSGPFRSYVVTFLRLLVRTLLPIFFFFFEYSAVAALASSYRSLT